MDFIFVVVSLIHWCYIWNMLVCSGINQSSVHGNAHTAGIYIYFQKFHGQHKNVISLVKRESRLMPLVL